MFYTLEEDFLSLIEAQSISAVEFFDNCMIAHRMSHIIVAMSPKDVIRLSQVSLLSSLSKRMLTFISNKANDYRSAMAAATRVVRVCTNSKTPNWIIQGQNVFLNYENIDQFHLLTQNFLLGEGYRDVRVMEVLCTIYLRTIQYPDQYIAFRELAGGGGALCQVLAAEKISPVKGVVLCDADTDQIVPPFPPDTTGQKAWDQATGMNLINATLGVSTCSPFFAFLTTDGRSIENMVRPNLLNLYFGTHHSFRLKRAEFLNAFPNFPNLDPLETIIWRSLNLKNGTSNMTSVIGEVRKVNGTIPPYITSKINLYSNLFLPFGLLDWLTESWTGKQVSRAVQKAIAVDLNEPTYRSAVSDWAKTLAEMAAGDLSAKRT